MVTTRSQAAHEAAPQSSESQRNTPEVQEPKETKMARRPKRKSADDEIIEANVSTEDVVTTTSSPKRQKTGEAVQEQQEAEAQADIAEHGDEDTQQDAAEREDVKESKPDLLLEVQLLKQQSKRGRSNSVADSQEDGDQTPQSLFRQLEEEASQHLSQSPEKMVSQTEKEKSTPSKQPALSVRPAIEAEKSKHVVFGGDADVNDFVAAAAVAAEAAKELEESKKEDEDEDESDDEAPEALSAQTAVAETLKAEQAISKAAERQEAALKRKRQERDEMFRQQAEKRKRARKTKASESKTHDSDEEEEDEPHAVTKATTSGRKRAEKLKLPNMLPEEFLTDSEIESEDERDLKIVKPTKINFETAVQTLKKEGRAPRDQMVGTTVYRVMADQGDKRLAPRMHKDSRFVKDKLLRRHRKAVVPAKTKGFFRRK